MIQSVQLPPTWNGKLYSHIPCRPRKASEKTLPIDGTIEPKITVHCHVEKPHAHLTDEGVGGTSRDETLVGVGLLFMITSQ